MKINMWMIANRLQGYDINTQIQPDAKRVITSALPVYSSNCVYIFQKGNDVVCRHEQGTITIQNINQDEGYMLIQSIFNWYNEWYDRIEEYSLNHQYQKFTEVCATLFQNPVMFQNSNYQLLGMDMAGVDINEVPEWKWTQEHNSSSLAGHLALVQAMRNPVQRFPKRIRQFSATINHEDGQRTKMSGLFARISFHGRDYGRLLVLDNNRAMNYGDVCLLEAIANTVSQIFAATDHVGKQRTNVETFLRLINNQPVSDSEIDYFISLLNARLGQREAADRQYTLLTLHLLNRSFQDSADTLLSANLQTLFPGVRHWLYEDDVVALITSPNPNGTVSNIYNTLQLNGYRGQVAIGQSLNFSDLHQLRYYYEQTQHAIREAENTPGIWNFYNYAPDFLLNTSDRDARLCACEPTCRRIWFSDLDRRSYLESLAVWLEYERAATLAASKLYIHKNTLNYRINYLKEHTDWNFEDPALRRYLQLSLYFLQKSSAES